ncbi:MAG: HDOD domain-containing protein, partial [Planctomycetes bacterium]|nr:HDOD domain-containing protein [Planctomycetota bacterium]
MTSVAKDLERIIERVPPLPEVAMRVLRIVDDVEFSMAKLVELVQTDPSLTAQLLRLCNSSLFALQSEITSIPQALSYLGIRHITRVVVTSCTSPYFKVDDVEIPYLKSTVIWRHSVACAAACQRLAKEIGGIDQGTAYTAGILHNIGKVPLGQLLHVRGRIDVEVSASGCQLLDVERELFGTDHAQVAGMVTDEWSVPLELKDAVRNHHDEDLIDESGILTAILHAADLLVLRAGISRL